MNLGLTTGLTARHSEVAAAVLEALSLSDAFTTLDAGKWTAAASAEGASQVVDGALDLMINGATLIAPGASSATFTQPAGSINIVDHGAVAGGPDCETAIWNATDAALLTAEKIVWFPAGVWHWSAPFALEARGGVTFVGAGYTQTTVYADDYQWASTYIKGDGGGIKQMKLTGAAAPSRQAEWERTKIAIWGATNFTIKDCWIEGAPAASIQSLFSSGGTGTAAANGYIGYNTIVGSLADSIHMTASISNVLIEHNDISTSGDDGISVVSYSGDGTPVTNITARGNKIMNNVSGRGMSVLGGEDIYYYSNYIEGNAAGYAGLYVTQEEAPWFTFAAKRIKIERNTVKNCGSNVTGHGGIVIYSGGGFTNDDIWFLRNDIVFTTDTTRKGHWIFGPQTNIKLDQYRYNGTGTAVANDTPGTSIVTVDTTYSAGPIGYTQPGTAAVSAYSEVSSVAAVNMTNKYFFLRVVRLPEVQNAAEGVTMRVRLTNVPDDSNWLDFFVEAGTESLIARITTSGVGADDVVVGTWSSTHAWLRMYEFGGTFYWDTAPSSADNPPTEAQWVNRRSVATNTLPVDLTNARIFLFTEVWQTDPGVVYLSGRLDGFNTAASSSY